MAAAIPKTRLGLLAQVSQKHARAHRPRTHKCLFLLCKIPSNGWIMRSHESIYGLLRTYMKESERYSLALITQPGREGGGTGGRRGMWLDSVSFQRKTSRTSSGKVQVTGSQCGNWRPLSEVSYVKRYAAVTSHL